MMNRTGLGIACALGAAAAYGLVPTFVRTGFENGVPPIESTLFRTGLLSVVFAVFAIVQGQSFAIPRPAIPSFVVQSIATFLVSAGYLASIQFIKVGLAVIIFFFFPVLIMLCAPLVEGRNPGMVRLAIALTAFVGLAVAIGPSFDSLDIRGILLAAAATFGATLQFFSGRAISAYLVPSVFGSLVHVAIFPAVLAAVLVVGGGNINILTGGSATAVGLTAMAGMSIIYVGAYLVHMLALRFAPASTVAPFFNLEPVTATVVAVLALGEKLELNQYVGGAIVLAALIASSLIGRGKTKAYG
jgi:drug/metabolite transporter (DMT)-like permease